MQSKKTQISVIKPILNYFLKLSKKVSTFFLWVLFSLACPGGLLCSQLQLKEKRGEGYWSVLQWQWVWRVLSVLSPFFLEHFLLHPIDGKTKTLPLVALSSHIGKSIHRSSCYKNHLSLEEALTDFIRTPWVFFSLLFFRFHGVGMMLLARCTLRAWSIDVGYSTRHGNAGPETGSLWVLCVSFMYK